MTFDHRRSVLPGKGRRVAAAQGVLWSGLQNLVSLAVTLAVFTVTSRILTEQAFGLVAFATSIVTCGLAAAPAALSEAIVQTEEIDEADLTALFWFGALSGISLFVILCFLGLWFAWVTDQPPLALITSIIAMRVLFECLAFVPLGLLQRRMDFRAMALRQLAGSMIGNLICLVLVLYGAGFWALVANNFLAALVSAIFVAGSAGWRPSRFTGFSRLKRFRRYGAYATGTRALQILRLDQLLVGLLTTVATLGAFYFANRILQILSQLSWAAVGGVTHSLLSSAQGQPSKLREGYLGASFAVATISLAIFGGLFMVAGDAIPLIFGKKWQAAVPVLQALCILGVFGALGTINGALFTSQGQVERWFWVQSASYIIRVLALSGVLLLGGSLPYAALAYSLAVLAVWPFGAVPALRLLGISAGAYIANLRGPLSGFALMLAGLYLVETLATLPLVAEVLLGGVLYTSMVLAIDRSRIMAMLSPVRA